MTEAETTTALVASAQILTGERSDDPKRTRDSWQDEAWSFYDDSGPLRYGVSWLANLISKGRLHAARVTPGGDEPEIIEDGPAAEAMEELAGGTAGQSMLLRSLTVQLTVPGIGYLVGTTGSNGNDWRILSSDVIKLKAPAKPGVAAVYETRETGSWEPLEPESLVVKIWRKHERLPWMPDSPTRAALPSLRELKRISQYIDAVLVSRLAGAGLLVIPKEATYPTANAQSTEGGGKPQHPFITEVLNVMMTAVKNPGTAAQVVPIPLEVPGDYVDKFKLVTWATELSDKILEMRESALRQTSITLDIPAEILTGMGDVNHWGQWQIEESAVKVHAEPLLEVITDGLTKGYLTPVLEAQSEDVDGIIVWADTSEMTARPDRSDDAMTLYNVGEVSGDGVRREAGIDESDKPTPEELADWAFKKMITVPALATMGLAGLGIPIPEVPGLMPAPDASDGAEEPVDEDGEDDSGASEETMPDTRDDNPGEPGEDVTAAAVDPRILVLEGHVLRALDVAKNRMRTKNRNVKPFDGAWRHASITLAEIGYDPVVTCTKLESFCETLLEQGMEYHRESLVRHLNGVCEAAA